MRGVVLFACLAAACAVRAGAPVEANTATLAQLEAISGVGTAMAGRIVQERERRTFRDWADLQHRLKGVGPKMAIRLSAEGLTVNGAAYRPEQHPASKSSRAASNDSR